MRAALYDRFGPPEVVSIREAPAPVAGPRELLVRVRAAALNPKDVLTRKGRFRVVSGRRFPRGVGLDLAGEVISLGPDAAGFAPGDRVMGMLPGWMGAACADLVAAPAGSCARAPAELRWEEAAALPLAGLTALQALRDAGRVRRRQRVCVNGAAGGVGSLTVQIARALGARVTAVARSSNRDLCVALGAEDVVAHDEEDVLDGRRSFDVLLDLFGNLPFWAARRAIVPGGTFVTTVPAARFLLGLACSAFDSRRCRFVNVRADGRDLAFLCELVQQGKLRAVIDSVLPLERISDAMGRVETRRARGKVVLVL